MPTQLVQGLLDPAILFFVLGVLIGAVRSNLEIPPALAKFFSLYLLVALGLKGGAELAIGGLPATGALALLAAMLMACVVPCYSFVILRLRRCDPFNAAAIAATYGSVSAVTFITAQQFLGRNEIEFGGYMAVALVLMESPAIVMAVLLATLARNRQAQQAVAHGAAAVNAGPELEDPPRPSSLSMKRVLHEAFTDGAHLLLIGSLLIGFVTGERGKEMMQPFTADIFKGILAFFLLELGLLVARQLLESQALVGRFLIGFAGVMPVVNASLALGLGRLLGLSQGDAVLVAVLASSASYIVVPAIVRYAIPEAQPGVYFTMALAVTFPFNILVGIPLYFWMSGLAW
ncbi:MAG: sodium-dependent bicarbonate transport family permease [Actinomycetota bacterium]